MVLAAAAALAFAAHAAPAHARLTRCAKSTDAGARVAVFEGSMRAWRGSQRLQLRFRLQSRTPQDPVWRAVRGPGVGGARARVRAVAVLRRRCAAVRLRQARGAPGGACLLPGGGPLPLARRARPDRR